ncbi:hypothetical protein Q73_04800 [Bacillus coahuilensis m2-6]|uniref:UPF0223 protein Q75_05365 n=1 Tax=Bacillus coahuilensis p1.1.43 TaxID=1150625 RepID=A0A147KAC9_9BACI|nr:UPF0223 family protein [Bacillus coahuilensis]KUP07655.1 hypothetical protein Q75_05365 [Bacillus coahuilensis p1.1.43]KUP08796.1 hypothetical protein Q73_04800 [Bacillus coahuilensis m2-6]
MEYQYPFSLDWSKDEVIDVIKFFELVERAYEKNVSKEQFMITYKRFKEIVPSKSEEKKICNEFEESSGYSSYHVVKKAKEAEDGQSITMK